MEKEAAGCLAQFKFKQPSLGPSYQTCISYLFFIFPVTVFTWIQNAQHGLAFPSYPLITVAKKVPRAEFVAAILEMTKIQL